jgi:hypothetical protein
VGKPKDILIFFFFFFLRQGLAMVAQVGLEFMVLLEPRECWDYRCVPPCAAIF